MPSIKMTSNHISHENEQEKNQSVMTSSKATLHQENTPSPISSAAQPPWDRNGLTTNKEKSLCYGRSLKPEPEAPTRVMARWEAVPRDLEARGAITQKGLGDASLVDLGGMSGGQWLADVSPIWVFFLLFPPFYFFSLVFVKGDIL